MALTLDQLGNLGLTAGQKTKIADAIAIGNALRDNPNPDISAVTPEQAKAINAFIRDVNTLLGPAFLASQYIRQKTKDDAAKAADDAVPGGTL